MVDQLASDYASQPVVFLEQVYSLRVGDRANYFWRALGSNTASYPMVMVDSGHQVQDGPVSYYKVYQQMVDAELARPPQADIQAFFTRVGDHLHFEVTVKNLSGVTLSYLLNYAKVHVIVYEDTKVYLTSRYVRAEVDTPISTSLMNGAAGSYSLDTVDLTGVDWTKLHAIALVDYLPSGASAFDMLQAAEAVQPSFSIQPSGVSLLIDSLRPADKTASIMTYGPSGITWTVTENTPWLSVQAASGSTGSPIVAQVSAGALASGSQVGTLHVQAAGLGVNTSQDISITAIYGRLFYSLLPIMLH